MFSFCVLQTRFDVYPYLKAYLPQNICGHPVLIVYIKEEIKFEVDIILLQRVTNSKGVNGNKNTEVIFGIEKRIILKVSYKHRRSKISCKVYERVQKSSQMTAFTNKLRESVSDCTYDKNC